MPARAVHLPPAARRAAFPLRAVSITSLDVFVAHMPRADSVLEKACLFPGFDPVSARFCEPRIRKET
jgi:hypothetical protein